MDRLARHGWRGLAVAIAIGAALSAATGPPASRGAERLGLLVELDGVIGPASVRHVGNAIKSAESRTAELLVLRMNTPGGLETSMREMITAIIASRVPVIGYVAPPGGRAASAGTYILYATHVAAMAPGTNVGAATPVQLGGLPGLPSGEPADKDAGDKTADKADRSGTKDAMSAKAVNDAVAFIRSLAELRGRNAEWAEKAVREAASLPASEALKAGVIDLIAADLEELLTAVDGRRVTAGGSARTLAGRGLAVERIEADFLTRTLGVLANPNIALILMMVGIYGLIYELATPGAVGPGVVGAICLTLALYALNLLPFNYTGLVLLIIGVGFMIAEAFAPTHGALGAGGLLAFVTGAAMLIDTDVPEFQISWSVIGGTAIASAALLSLLLGYVWRSHRLPLASGPRELIGSQAEVLDWSQGEGHVWARGERWQARGAATLAKGQRVRVVNVEGLTLEVSPAAPQSAGEPAEHKGA